MLVAQPKKSLTQSQIKRQAKLEIYQEQVQYLNNLIHQHNITVPYAGVTQIDFSALEVDPSIQVPSFGQTDSIRYSAALGYGSGELGSTGSGLGGGGSADGLGGLGNKGTGRGSSGYGSGGGSYGKKKKGGIGKIGGAPIILGSLDKSLIDAPPLSR